MRAGADVHLQNDECRYVSQAIASGHARRTLVRGRNRTLAVETASSRRRSRIADTKPNAMRSEI